MLFASADLLLTCSIRLARSYVAGMGGNALVGYSMESINLSDVDNAYCVISLSGDAVLVQPKTLLH